jgi:hypothetical protein
MKERKKECYAPIRYKRLNKSVNYKGLEVYRTKVNLLIGTSNYDGYITRPRWVGIDKNNQRTCFYTTKKEVIAEIDRS